MNNPLDFHLLLRHLERLGRRNLSMPERPFGEMFVIPPNLPFGQSETIPVFEFPLTVHGAIGFLQTATPMLVHHDGIDWDVCAPCVGSSKLLLVENAANPRSHEKYMFPKNYREGGVGATAFTDVPKPMFLSVQAFCVLVALYKTYDGGGGNFYPAVKTVFPQHIFPDEGMVLTAHFEVFRSSGWGIRFGKMRDEEPVMDDCPRPVIECLPIH